MRRLKIIIISLVAVFGIGLAPTSVMAATTVPQDNMEEICANNPDSSVCKEWQNNQDPEGQLSSTVRNIINVLLFGIGIMAVVSIIISGLRFSSSRGDTSATQKARTQLIYSVVGLVVSALAFAIVNFVFASLGGGGGGSGGGSQTACPSGQSLNTITNICEPTNVTTCPSGQSLNTITGLCE